MNRLAMLKVWVSKYRDRHCGYFQTLPLIVARLEFTKIQTLLSTLQEPANNAYTCTVLPLECNVAKRK